MKLVAKELSLAAILALPVNEQDALARTFVKGNAHLKETKDTQKEAAKVMGKLLCALEIRLNTAKKALVVAADLSLAEYFKMQYGDKPQTHPLSLKNAFSAFVETRRITEADYDNNSGNCLELAARIVAAVKGDLEHDAVKQAAAQLMERSNKEAANLREILASVKPTAKLTPEEALELIQQIFADGQGAVVLAETPDIILAMSEADQRSMYLSFAKAMERFDKAAGDKIDAWVAEQTAAETKAAAPIHVITAETPAAEPFAEFAADPVAA